MEYPERVARYKPERTLQRAIALQAKGVGRHDLDRETLARQLGLFSAVQIPPKWLGETI